MMLNQSGKSERDIIQQKKDAMLKKQDESRSWTNSLSRIPIPRLLSSVSASPTASPRSGERKKSEVDLMSQSGTSSNSERNPREPGTPKSGCSTPSVMSRAGSDVYKWGAFFDDNRSSCRDTPGPLTPRTDPGTDAEEETTTSGATSTMRTTSTSNDGTDLKDAWTLQQEMATLQRARDQQKQSFERSDTEMLTICGPGHYDVNGSGMPGDISFLAQPPRSVLNLETLIAHDKQVGKQDPTICFPDNISVCTPPVEPIDTDTESVSSSGPVASPTSHSTATHYSMGRAISSHKGSPRTPKEPADGPVTPSWSIRSIKNTVTMRGRVSIVIKSTSKSFAQMWSSRSGPVDKDDIAGMQWGMSNPVHGEFETEAAYRAQWHFEEVKRIAIHDRNMKHHGISPLKLEKTDAIRHQINTKQEEKDRLKSLKKALKKKALG